MNNVQSPDLSLVSGSGGPRLAGTVKRSLYYPAQVQRLTNYLEAIGQAVDHVRGETDPTELWVYLDAIGAAVTEALESAS